MNNIIKYQEIDIKLSKIEKELKNNEARKKSVQYANFIKDAESTLIKLESKAGDIANSIKNLIDNMQQCKNLIEEYQKDIEDIQNYDEAKYIKNKIAQDNSSLEEQEKLFAQLLQDAEKLSKEYEAVVANATKAKTLLPAQKKLFDDIVKEKRPEVEALKAEQAEIKATLDEETLAKYNSVRKQGILPVFVPLINGKSCGGCRMELTDRDIAQLTDSNTIKCENCFRRIYLEK